MRKIFIAAAAALTAMVACQKNEIATPAAEDSALYATIEETDATKTYMDANNNIRWSEGDLLVGFMKSSLGLKYQILPSSVGKTSAFFKKISGGDDYIGAGTEWDHNIVYYPYSDAAEAAKSGSVYNIEVVLPSEQTYAEDSFGEGAMAMVAVSEDNDVIFRNVLGGMKLQLRGTQKVASVTLEGKNREKLSGKATVTAYPGETKPAITMSSSASASVTLDCGSGVQLSESAATEFIIALPPVEFVGGFKVTVTDDLGNGYVIETSKKNTVYRSSILVMPAVTLGEPDIPGTEAMPDYIDELGINQGSGVKIDDVIWAPVNCGYHETDYPYGKLYQWGRKYGQGKSGDLYDVYGKISGEYSDATLPVTEDGGVSSGYGNHKDNENVLFTGIPETNYDWLYPSDDALWNSGTKYDPIKTMYDPCPDGWRVPVYSELVGLSQNHSYWTTDDNGHVGFWFSGTVTYADGVSKVFFPAAGGRTLYEGYHNHDRGGNGFYWSSDAYVDGGVPRCDVLLLTDGSVSQIGNIRSDSFSVRCVYDADAVGMEWPAPDEDVAVSVASVVLNSESLELREGDTAQLTAKVLPSDATDKTVVWTSSDLSIATVGQDGLVRAVSAGEAKITAVAGGVSATCSVTVSSLVVATANYVDEYGKDHGKGVKIDGVIWAPVNCGYHETDYPYGKLYQWGRKYGQGYSEYPFYSDATVPEIMEGGVSLAGGQSEENANVFFLGDPENYYDWLYPSDKTLWNSGTEKEPVKTEYDPCPDGWRVPTYAELDELSKNKSSWTTNDKNQEGYWFSGQSSYTSSVPQVFFPAAGFRNYDDGDADRRGDYGIYWSSRLNNRHASSLGFGIGYAYIGGNYRAHGDSVRCVQVTD